MLLSWKLAVLLSSGLAFVSPKALLLFGKPIFPTSLLALPLRDGDLSSHSNFSLQQIYGYVWFNVLLPPRSECEENFPFSPSRVLVLRLLSSRCSLPSLACNSLDFSQPSILFHRFFFLVPSPHVSTSQRCSSFHMLSVLILIFHAIETLC